MIIFNEYLMFTLSIQSCTDFLYIYFGSVQDLHLFNLHELACWLVFFTDKHCSSTLISKCPEKGCGSSLDPHHSQTEIGINTFKYGTYVYPILWKYFYNHVFYVCVSVCELAAEAFGSLLT